MLIIPIFVPHAGCPHDCCFCNQKIISGQTSMPTEEDIIATIKRFEKAATRYNDVQLAFYGGSFTAIEIDLQLMFLKTVQPYLKSNGGFIDKLRLSTRPDCIDAEVLERMHKYGVGVIELGAQSMDAAVLLASGRGHTAEDTIKASSLIKEKGFELGIQTMTGLPLADYASDIETARKVCEMKPDFVRIYPTVVVKGTALHRSYLAGRYVPQTLEEAVELCLKLSDIYAAANVQIIRMGLQSSDNISEDGEIAAGPYHAAFGQLVKSKQMYVELCRKIEKIDIKEYYDKILCVYVDTARLSDCIGQKRENVKRLKEKYGFRQVFVKEKKKIVQKEKNNKIISVIL